MANKRKCKNKECGLFFKPDTLMDYPRQEWCSSDCREAIALQHYAKLQGNRLKARSKAEKAQKKVNARKKREFRESDVKTRKAAAKSACHKYIRERDKGLPCICCNEPLGETFHAGHWQESGNNSQIRYDETNIHGQRIYCNTYKGGDSGDYEKNLRDRIGDEAVELLLTKKGGVMKRTAQDYLEIENHYKQKLKELEGQL